MKKVISSEKIPIKIWADDVEDGALQQAKNLANLPFAYKHIAIMPDVHQGYGMPIGGVLATKGVIVPNAVGVDIGCGMCAVKTPWEEISTDRLFKIVEKIKLVVPVGFKHHSLKQDISYMPSLPKGDIVTREWEKALFQIGTLGGGNHFIEVQKGSDNFIWIMIHSGSRNLGKQVADFYNKRAKKLNSWWHSKLPEQWDLSFLPKEAEKDYNDYLTEMNFCVEFAFQNRKLMMERVISCFESVIRYLKIDIDNMINIAHNYAAMENHFGQNIIVHRKGATRAREGEIGIIPGSQGTKSYIVKGKGNPQSFMSCSHGAGRIMGRNEAKRLLSLEEQQKLMNSKGIIHSIESNKDLDEAPGAYKDIDLVMKNQEDLVEILVELTPLAVIKG